MASRALVKAEDPATRSAVHPQGACFTVAGCQLVSNVPFVILAGEWIPRLAEPGLLWLATALAATLAGNLAVIGSVANVIVLELAGSRVRIGFWAFFRVGLLVTAATLVAGLGLLLAERTLGLIRGAQALRPARDSPSVPRSTHPGIGAERRSMRNSPGRISVRSCMVATVAFAGLPFTSFAFGEVRSLDEPLTAEAAWTRAATRGDRQAFGRLVDLHKRAVYGLCVRLLREPEEARDAAQEAFTRAYGALSTYDARQPFAPWLLRIARNHCLDVLRRRLPDAQRLELDADPEEAAPRELADPAALQGDQVLERRELAGALERAVSALPANYREVVHLFHVEHLSYKEIASTLDVPIGTVMTWLHRARARLKDALTAGGTEALP